MNRILFYIFLTLTGILITAGCSIGLHATVVPDYKAIRPNSIAVLPVANDTVDMKAPDVVRPIVYQKVIEWGYESPTPQLISQILSKHKIRYAGEVNQFTPKQLGEMFNVDAILYTTITDWSTTWLAVYASQTVGLKLKLRSAKDNRILWEGQYTYTKRAIATNNRQMIDVAIGAALSPYQPLVRRAVNRVFKKLPYGPHYIKPKGCL